MARFVNMLASYELLFVLRRPLSQAEGFAITLANTSISVLSTWDIMESASACNVCVLMLIINFELIVELLLGLGRFWLACETSLVSRTKK